MDIAALSVGLSSAKLMQQASLSMTKKSMDMQQQQMNGLIDLMQSTQNAPSFGHKLDVRA